MDTTTEGALTEYAKRHGLYAAVPDIWNNSDQRQRRDILNRILRPLSRRRPCVALPRFKDLCDGFARYPTDVQIEEWSLRTFALLPPALWPFLVLAYDSRTNRFSFLTVFCRMWSAGYRPPIVGQLTIAA